MPIALDPQRTVLYTLKAERAGLDPTVFALRSLTHRQRAEVEDVVLAHEPGRVVTRVAEARRLRLRYGLTGWSKFRDASGADVKFEADKDGRPTEAALDRLDDETSGELADAIHELSTVTVAQGN